MIKIKKVLLFSAVLSLLLSGCHRIEDKPQNSFAETIESTGQTAESTDESTPSVTILQSDPEPIDEPAVDYPIPVPEEFIVRLEEIQEKYDITGMSVALFKDGQIIHTANLGYADVQRNIPADDNTRYRCASVSKLVTSMILMQLYDEGKITPDTLLEEATGLHFGKDVRLWHLMTHTAGFWDSETYNESLRKYYTADYVLEHSRIRQKAGEAYIYTNCGAGMMGAVIEKLTGQFFHDYAKESFFDRLGMDAGYTIDLIEDKESAATLYDKEDKVYRVSTWERFSWYYERFGLGNSYLTAQCELIITASDLARLGIALSGDGSVDGIQVISPDAVRTMNTVYFETPEYDMGLNVRIYDNIIEGREIHGHPGNALGAICGLYFDPADGTGVALLTNHCSQAVCDNGVYRAIQETLEAAYEYCF